MVLSLYARQLCIDEGVSPQIQNFRRMRHWWDFANLYDVIQWNSVEVLKDRQHYPQNKRFNSHQVMANAIAHCEWTLHSWYHLYHCSVDMRSERFKIQWVSHRLQGQLCDHRLCFWLSGNLRTIPWIMLRHIDIMNYDVRIMTSHGDRWLQTALFYE